MRSRGRRASGRLPAIVCEWVGCGEREWLEYRPFRDHVRGHCDYGHDSDSDSPRLRSCEWESCGFETRSRVELALHVNYHAYHARLKAVGAEVRERCGLPDCSRPLDGRNRVPDLTSKYGCGWIDCEFRFDSAQEYFDHVAGHAAAAASDADADGSLTCGWLGCGSRFRFVNKLRDHTRRHTGERVVACDRCGGTFATNAVFEDHCARQASSTGGEYRCDKCEKPFASERLMRNHSRRHINSYKCPYCSATSSAPSALAKHIRYRHLDYRPFECGRCDYKAVSELDMRAHTLRHEGIVAAKGRAPDSGRVYACHYCDSYFNDGFGLTKHLVRYHGYDKRTSGFVRLRYERSEDGLYRLITLRYESLEVSKQIMAEKDDGDAFANGTPPRDFEFEVIESSLGNPREPASFVVLPSRSRDSETFGTSAVSQRRNRENATFPPKKTTKRIKTGGIRPETEAKKSRSPAFGNEYVPVEISIAHVDADGNIIKSEVIESPKLL